MKSNEIDERKTKYFVIAILILIVLSILLIIHFNNKSLVSGEKDKTTKTTTTELITTNKKTTRKRTTTQAIVADSTIYKSTIDEETKIVYNYKLTDEILESDQIISKVLEVDETLKANNVIGLFDISLYDVNLVKKSVNNSSIEISIPLSKELLGYDEYKIVYIDDNNKISDELFDSVVENNYIKFTTTHLSKFGIVATKKEVVVEEEKIDLTNVKLDLKINDKVVSENNLYVKTVDKIELNVNGLEKDVEYKLYYLLQNEEVFGEYKEFNSEMLKDIKTPSTYKLIIKLVVGEYSKTFELATVNIYDEVFVYDKNEEITEDIIIGEVKDEDGVESTYEEKDTNMNIVIDNVTVEEEVVEETTPSEEESNDTTLEETLPGESESNDEVGTPVEGENTETELPEETIAKIILKGNVYLVEETDISELEMTGHLIIDTEENITMNGENKSFDLSKLYTIYIKSEYFSIDGVNYKYEIKDGNIVITKLAEKEENNEVVTKENFESLFDGFEYDEKLEELLLSKKEVPTENETNNNTEESPENNTETKEEQTEEAITK